MRHITKHNLGHQKGDTIVEVLLAIAVISSVLGGAYVSASQSLNATRRSQERAEALQLAQGQMERVKASSKNSTSPIYTTASFCIDTANTFLPIPPNPVCQDSSLGTPYNISVEATNDLNACPVGGPRCVFTVLATWDRAGGGPAEQMKIIYRLYPF